MIDYTNADLLTILREECQRLNPPKSKRGGQKIWAKLHGISPQYLGEILKETRPLPEFIVNMLDIKLYYVEGWSKIPKSRRPKSLWSREELMEHVRYDVN